MQAPIPSALVIDIGPSRLRIEGWHQLAELRQAALAPRIGPWKHALSGFSVGARTELLAAMVAARSRVLGPPGPPSTEVAITASICFGTLRYESLVQARDGELAVLGAGWGWSASQIQGAVAAVCSVIGPGSLCGVSCSMRVPGGLGRVSVFPHLSMLAHVALAQGLVWDLALPALARTWQGRFDGAHSQFWCVLPSGVLAASEHPPPWSAFTLAPLAEGDPSLQLVLCGHFPVAVLSSESLTPRLDRPRERSRSRFLPAYIRLPRDEHGRLEFPSYRVTSLIERRDEWSRIIGNVDGVTWAILNGRLVYPRSSWMLRGSWLRNHPSFERDDVKAVLGPKIATYLAQGALEWVPPWCPPPLYIEPTGAVDKPGPDRFRMISDARFGNKGLSHWGVRYHTALDFAASLDFSYFSFVDDVRDGYHLACLMGCHPDLVWDYGLIGFEDDPDDADLQRPVWGLKLHVGCGPGCCLRACDKSANGVCLDGCIMRWAVAHFGQGPAGSPLNCIALCLLRHMARRSGPRFEAARLQAVPASRAIAAAGINAEVMSLEPHHLPGTQGVVWVDDFAFSVMVPYHRPCTGVSSGCLPPCPSTGSGGSAVLA